MKPRYLKLVVLLSLFSGAALVTTPVRVSSAPSVTFNKDIAPILYSQCASCHRPGEVAPFSLLSYQDAGKRAKQIAAVTARRYMPPWKPEPGFGDFADSRRLTDDQIAKIQQWADAGAPEGDPSDRMEPPKFTEGWQLGTPDLVVRMPDPYTVPADGRDIYRCFVVPLNLGEDKKVAAVEFRPGNRKVVHHAILRLERRGSSRQRNNGDSEPGYNCFGGGGVNVEGGLGGWVPGQTPRFLADGIARPVSKDADLVIQNHYHPDGKTETDQSTVGIYFAKSKPSRTVLTVPVISRNIYIPAGDASYRVTASFTTPIRLEVTDVSPHMHLLGKQMKVTATLPDGSIKPMIWIKDWDFNWQGQYTLQTPMVLPAGTRIDMEAVFDNSKNNPRNPNSPPKTVTWGEQTTDEMAIVFLQSVSSNPIDRALILAALARQLAPFGNSQRGGERGAGMQALIDNPDVVYRLLWRNSSSVTREEFRQLIPQQTDIADLIFDQLDANNDRAVTPDEFRKISDLLRGSQ